MTHNLEVDDVTICHDTNLLRRIAPQVHYKEDQSSQNGFRVTSAAFKNPSGSKKLSVVIEKRTPHSHKEIVLMKSPRHGLIAITAAIVRAHRQIVKPSPNKEEPGHGDVIGDKPKEIRTAFASSCNILIEPNSLVP